MFYGRTTSSDGYGNGRGNRNDRLEQMSKQQQLIEQKKQEIQAKLEAERQRKAMEAILKQSSSAGRDSNTSTASSSSNKQREETEKAEPPKPAVVNLFTNDGSFMDQFRKMQEEAKKKKEEEENNKAANENESANEYGAMKPMMPVIKIINPEQMGMSSPNPSFGTIQAPPPPPPPPPPPVVKSTAVPPPNFYHNAPPPPPPPPPVHNTQMHANPYYGKVAPPPPPPPPPPISQDEGNNDRKHFGSFPSPAVKALAMKIAGEGDDVEERARMTSRDDPLMWFLYRPDSAEYRRFRDLVSSIKQEKGFSYVDSGSVFPKKEPGFEYGCGKGDTDLRAEFSKNSEYGSNVRAKTESDSEYGSSKPCFSDFKSEYGTDRGNGGGGVGRSDYGFVKSEPLVPADYGKSEYGTEPDNKSEYGFIKSEADFSKKPDLGFVYGGKMMEPKVENSAIAEIKSEYGGQQNYESGNEYGDESRVKSEYGSEGSSDGFQQMHQHGGIKREYNRDVSSGDEEDERERRERKRRSRWGPQSGNAPPVAVVAPAVTPEQSGTQGPNPWILNAAGNSSVQPSPFQMQAAQQNLSMMGMPVIPIHCPTPSVAKVTRTNPQLLAYAKQAYGTTDLDDEQWKQCEEAYKMNLVFQEIAQKKARHAALEKAGKFKHEYDSDEEVDGGTWEHKQRMKEMEKTKKWADDLTQKAKGKHHIGDFLPPEELAKFMEKYQAVKEGRQLDQSDYQEFKIQQDNIGFKMLQKMGWSDGQGLGASGQGITAPVDKGNVVTDKQGLGVEKPSELTDEDDEYTAYRKRMMLAYRFRPNPLNNPRRPYY